MIAGPRARVILKILARIAAGDGWRAVLTCEVADDRSVAAPSHDRPRGPIGSVGGTIGGPRDARAQSRSGFPVRPDRERE